MDAAKTGALIAQARKEKDLTQGQLAQRLHVSVQAVSKWERGRNFPDLALLEPLAEALDLTVSELLAGERGEPPQETAVREALALGAAQLKEQMVRWRGAVACLLLIALFFGLIRGYVWVRDHTELLPQGEKRLAQRESEEKTAKLQADRSKERQAQWENKLSAVSAKISSLWGTLPEERQGQNLDQAEQGLQNSLTEVQARLESLRKKIQETQEASAKTGEALAAAAAGERALRNQTHEAKEQWEAAGREIPGELNQEALEQEYASLQEESRESLQKTGRLLQKRKSLEQAAAKIRDLEEESKAVQEEYSKTERIARFFSGKNPMNVPLKMFVLGVMLDDILSRANVYFTTLSGGRYQLSRKREGASRGYSGLDLEIYDAYSGGGRNVDTLSGGELFLASLSLAFGLSDVVQSYSGGVRLESIFIDEGFGTLDEETLNTAMKALFEIQKSGRTVGIISHVAELKSRIPAQIRILDDHKIKVVLP